jgi:hypothetical protein
MTHFFSELLFPSINPSSIKKQRLTAVLLWHFSLTPIIPAFAISMGWREEEAPFAYLIWGGLAILFALGDIRNLYHSGLSGNQRIIRHVLRIGFSLVWATLAFTDKIVKMMGANVKSMQGEQLLLIVGIPTMLIVITILYWITKILFFSNERFARYGEPTGQMVVSEMGRGCVKSPAPNL